MISQLENFTNFTSERLDGNNFRGAEKGGNASNILLQTFPLDTESRVIVATLLIFFLEFHEVWKDSWEQKLLLFAEWCSHAESALLALGPELQLK